VKAATHPLRGRVLAATSFVHRSGVLYLVVELPDGMRGTIPASATDVFGESEAAGPGVVLDAGGVRRLRALMLALGGRDGAGW
jgi:hypothetical protein